MALNLKLPKLFGAHHAVAATADLDMPTTQVRAAQPGYDPLASVSIMEQLRSATSEMKLPRRLPWIAPADRPAVPGPRRAHGDVPRIRGVHGVPRQPHGVAGRGRGVDRDRNADALAAAGARTALASQGQAAAFPALKDSRERFKADLEALQGGGTVKGVSLDVSQDETVVKLLGDIRARWDRLDVNAGRVIDNQQSLTTLAKGLENINLGNNAILELAQQTAQQIGQGGGSLREIEYANQLAVLRSGSPERQRARRRRNRPRRRLPARPDTATFRDILNGLIKGSERAPPGVRSDDRALRCRIPSASPATTPAWRRSSRA
jgi:hypothetical protein